MSIPTLILPSQWETKKTTTLIENSTELGDGYIEYMSVGLNPVKVEWDVKSPILTRNKVNLVIDQLERFAGFINFSWSPDNGISVPPAVYFCEEWDVTPYAPNAFMIEAKFISNGEGECIALAANTDIPLIKSYLEGMINFFNTYTRTSLPMVANAQGVTVNAFHTVDGRGGYFPPSVGTSEGQSIMIEGLLMARKAIDNPTIKTTALNLALLYSNALIQYFYQEAIPTVANSKIWLPHWLVNAKQSFISKGILRSKAINSGYFDIPIVFNDGIGYIPTGDPNWGDKLSDVYRVYSTNGKLLWQNVYAPVSFGTEYSINYWVAQSQLNSSGYRTYPNSSSSGGSVPSQTSETIGMIVLNSDFTGTLLVVYSAYTGDTIGINEPLEAYPIIRPTQSNPKEKNHALDVSAWCHNVFTELYDATGNIQWKRAKDANIYSTVLASQVINDSYLFKIDSTSTDPWSYPGTQLIISNNSAGGIGSRTSSGWVKADINNGSELYPVAELQNFAVTLQLESNSSIEMSFGCSVSSIMEVYLSLSKNASDNTKIYTYYQPVVGGVDISTSILPSEFIRYKSDNWWHCKIAENPTYSYNSVGSTVSNSIGLITIDNNRRLISTITMNKISEGYCGTGFVMFNVGNEPPEIYYSKIGSSVKLKIVDSLNQTYFWNLPDTGNDWNSFKPVWTSADTNTNVLPGDGTIQSLEIVSDGVGTSITKVWWIGASPEILPFPCFTYKGGVVSRVDTAHTFKVGNFRGINSPIATLKGSPGVIPFTANLIQNSNGNYTIDTWRGTQPFSGYQDPNMWQEWGYSDRAQQVISFLEEAQQAYATQNIYRTFGPFSPAYNWSSWENGVTGTPNTWTFKNTIDPSSDWSGYQYRPLVSVAKYWKSNPKDARASNIVMSFLGMLDSFYRRNNDVTPPTNYIEYGDPITNYLSIQDPALIARAALYANLAGGDPAITYRMFKKSLDLLMSEYVSTGTMAGTFTKSQPSLTNNGVNIKELFPFQHGEIMITLAEIIKYKDQLKYPACSVSLT